MNRYEKTQKLEDCYSRAKRTHRGQSLAFTKLFRQQLRNLRVEARVKKRSCQQVKVVA